MPIHNSAPNGITDSTIIPMNMDDMVNRDTVRTAIEKNNATSNGTTSTGAIVPILVNPDGSLVVTITGTNIDPEVVCASNDGGVTKVKAIAVFDVSVNPPTVTLYDFAGVALVGYTVVECDDVEYDIENAGFFCVNGTDTLNRFDVINSETQAVVSSYWTDLLGVVVPTPVGVVTAGACSIAVVNYDNNETQVNVGVTPIILLPATYHSVSVAIITGSATIDNNGVSFVAPAGYTTSWEASTLLTNQITITATSALDVFVVDTIN